MVIKKFHALLVKSRDVIPSTGTCQSWPPNNPHPLDWLYDSLSSPPVAGVWCVVVLWQPPHYSSGYCTLVEVEERPPPPPPHTIVKCFGCTTIHNKALYKCIIHSYVYSLNTLTYSIYIENICMFIFIFI